MYRLNLIMRNYLDNQRELINTHKQYLELNNLYQQNITSYMNFILRNSVNDIDSDDIINQDDVESNRTYDLLNSSNIHNNIDNTNNIPIIYRIIIIIIIII